MNRYYDVRLLMDSVYGIYEKGKSECLFQGTLAEIDAWLSLKARGFDI